MVWKRKANNNYDRPPLLHIVVRPARGGGGGGGGEGHSLIWVKRGRATGQGMVFWPRCAKQGIHIYLPLS